MTTIVYGFADGENLVNRYQSLLSAGASPMPGVSHVQDLLVWHPNITRAFACKFHRISYYQTHVGTHDAIDAAKARVCEERYAYLNESSGGTGSLYPKIYKKEKRSSKTKSVDINLSIDILRCAMSRATEVVYLMSGDGDYLPLVEEVHRLGVQVWLGAFSSGLSQDLRYAADDFINLDEIFFQPKVTEVSG